MKAIVKSASEKGVEYKDIPKPTPGRGEVLIEVQTGAICGTDIHYYLWNQAAVNFSSKFGLKFPFVLGHEVCGTVCEVGSEVKNVKVGQRVSVETHIPCGKCYQCQTGQAHNCQDMLVYGTSCSGSFAEYALAPASVIFPLPDSISFEEGCLFEPAGVAMRSVEESGLVPGDTVVIFGCGPIGLLTMQILKTCGAGKIIAVDINDYRLDLAAKYSDLTVNSMKENVVEVIQNATKARGGADVILEMSGSPKVYEVLFDCLRLEGHIVTVGHPAGEVSINITRNVNTKGASIKGLFGRRIWDTWWKLLPLVEGKKINIMEVVTHKYNFDQYEEAFEQSQKNAGKILFVKK